MIYGEDHDWVGPAPFEKATLLHQPKYFTPTSTATATTTTDAEYQISFPALVHRKMNVTKGGRYKKNSFKVTQNSPQSRASPRPPWSVIASTIASM